MTTTDRLMFHMGFLPTDTGPHVTALRERVSRQIEAGLVNRSGGTWGDEARDFETGKWKITPDQRAKFLLAVDWEVEHGQTYEVKAFGRPFYWSTDVRTMERTLVIKWDSILPWVGDRFRAIGAKVRIAKNKFSGNTNPYR